MNAMFVQVDEAELAGIIRNPSQAEGLFAEPTASMPAPSAMTKTMQDRVRALGPRVMADTLARLPEEVRQRMEARLGQTAQALAAGSGGDMLLKMMQERMASRNGLAVAERETMSLDKAWHGVHFLLCGQAEPGESLLSHAVLGGVELGDDPEGFSGYGPARYFTCERVAEIARELGGAEAEAARRFDPERMCRMRIYPSSGALGWKESDSEWAMEGFRKLRDFYADAARNRRAVVTCLV